MLQRLAHGAGLARRYALWAAMVMVAGCGDDDGDVGLLCADGTSVVALTSSGSGETLVWFDAGALWAMDLVTDECRILTDDPLVAGLSSSSGASAKPLYAVDESVYAAVRSSGQIVLLEVDLETGEVSEIGSHDSALPVWDMAVDDSYVYVAGYADPGQLVRFPRAGGAGESVLEASHITGVVAMDGGVYAGTWSGTLWDASDAEAPATMAESVTTMQSLSGVGGMLYVNSWSTGQSTVIAVSPEDGSRSEVGVTDSSARFHMADESGIYLPTLDQDNGHPTALVHMSLDGRTRQLGPFVPNMSFAKLALSDRYVFWHLPGGTVSRAFKP